MMLVRSGAHLAFVMFMVLAGSSGHARTDNASGIHPFQTYFGGQYDTIDPISGNIMVTIPVINKTAGKLPFSFNLVGNFHAYLNGTVAVASSINGVLVGGTATLSKDRLPDEVCYEGTPNQAYTYTDTNFSVSDHTGASHSFGYFSVSYGDCGIAPTPQSVPAVDGSGYLLVVIPNIPPGSMPAYTIYDRSGNRFDDYLDGDPYSINTGHVFTVTDPDGVQMKWRILRDADPIRPYTLHTAYTDTLDQNILTSTTVASHDLHPATAGDPDVFVYRGPNDSLQTVQINYTYFPQKTTFGCPNVPELDMTIYPDAFRTNFPTSIVMPDGEIYRLAYEPTVGFPGHVTGRLAKITLPGGGSISFTYSGERGGFNCGGGVATTLMRTVDDGRGHSSVWTYSIPGPDQYGNRTVTVVDPFGATTTYSFNGNYQTAMMVKDSNNLVLSTSVTCYNGSNTSQADCIAPIGYSNIVAPPLIQKDVYTSLGTEPFSLVQTKYDYHVGSYGNIESLTRYDVGATFPPSGTPVSTTATTYANVNGNCGSLFAYIHDRPCVVTTSDASGLLALTSYIYDGKGHPIQTSRFVNRFTYVTSYATYNTNGTLASLQDARGATTTYQYDGPGGCNGLLPTSTWFPADGLTTSQTWDCNGGMKTSVTDLNTTTTYYTYDSLWRLTGTSYPDGSQRNVTYNFAATPPNLSASQRIDNAGRWQTTQTIFDGLGRPIQQQLTSDPFGTVYTDTVYDAAGRVRSISNPYRNTNESTFGVTQYLYDDLGRTCIVVPPGGTSISHCPTIAPVGDVFTKYDGNCITVTDEVGKRRTSCYDGLGRLKQVYEDPGGLNYETSYQYDGLDNLVRVDQKGGTSTPGSWRTRTFAYDWLSRLVCVASPEVSVTTCPSPDPGTYTVGTTRYTYDANGNLQSKIAPTANQPPGSTATTTTTYSYDALNRLQSKLYSDATPAVQFYYDIAPAPWGNPVQNTKGRIVKVTTGITP